jgi:galactose mutarotase-like enzyme
MSVVLENQEIKVSVKPAGAELTSLFNKRNNKEYLWNADDKVWGRHAPILFPIVGKLKDQKYTYEGRQYTLPQHGFARDMNFEVVESSSSSVAFQLTATEDSLKNYPFKFLLEVRYELKESSVDVKYSVRNLDSKSLPFSLGAHPGFNCPIGEDEQYEDYFFEFEKEEELSTWLLNEGLLSGETISLGKTNKIYLTKELFQNDALVFKHLQSEKVTLKSSKSNNSIALTFPGFPYLGLWTKPGTSKFVCIEPWCGIADGVGASGNILQKEGIRVLEIGKSFDCSYNIKIK